MDPIELVTPAIGLMFWTCVVFTLLLILLKKFAWKPILSAVDERNNSIESALAMAEKTRGEMAHLLKRALLRLDGLFGKPMPYVLSVQLAPKGYEDSYHFTVQLWPLRRDVNKMKFLASVEQVSGVFLVDVPPDVAAAQLKAVEI